MPDGELSVLDDELPRRVELLARVAAGEISQLRRRRRPEIHRLEDLLLDVAVLVGRRDEEGGSAATRGRADLDFAPAPGQAVEPEAAVRGRNEGEALAARLPYELVLVHGDPDDLARNGIPVGSREAPLLPGRHRDPRFRALLRLQFWRVPRHQGPEVDLRDLLREAARIGAREVAEAGDRELLLRKAQELRPVPHPRATVADGGQALVPRQKQGGRVVELLAAVQNPDRLHRVEQLPVADLRLVKVLVPQLEVLHGRLDRAVPRLLPVPHIDPEAAALGLAVPRGAVRDDPRVQVVELRVPHAERPEDTRFREVAQRLAARPLDDDRQQEVTRVRVEMLLARGEVRRLLAGDRRERVLVGRQVLGLDALELHDLDVIAQAAGMMEEITDRDFLSVVRDFRHPLADIVVERQLPIAGEQVDRECRELLRGRADVEHRLRRIGHAELEVRHPVAALVDDPAVPVDAEGAAGGVGAVVIVEHCIDLRLRVGGGNLRGGARRGERQEYREKRMHALPP